jgi:hypothetical protein
MNVIIYNALNNKQINGTLFYAFEYYCFLNKFTDVKLIIFNQEDPDFVKNTFRDKYNIEESSIQDIIFIDKHTDIFKMKIKNAMILDLRTYSKLKPFLKNSKLRVYSNKTEKFEDHDTTFYGFYSYQNFSKKTRLKFYTDIHKTFDEHGENTFLSFLAGNGKQISNELRLSNAIIKSLNEHNDNLFKKINKIIYYHTGALDVNNRIVVESFIHKIPLKVYFNGHFNDSIFERTYELERNGLKEFVLDSNDILIEDFLKDCNDILPKGYKQMQLEM